MKEKTINVFEERALTWNDLAEIYDLYHSGRPARTLPMNTILNWAEKQEDKFVILEDSTIHKKLIT